MESPGPGAELQVRRAFDAFGTVPNTGSAEHALLAIERRRMVFAARDRLTGAHFNPKMGAALATDFKVAEGHMVGVSSGRLHLTADHQSVLVRDEKRAVVNNLRPSAAGHQLIVQRQAATLAFFADPGDLFGAQFAAVKRFETLKRGICMRAAKRGMSFTKSAHGHADHAGNDAAMKSVARFLGDAALAFDPTGAALLFVGTVQILTGERLFGLQQFQRCFGKQRTRSPRFIYS